MAEKFVGYLKALDDKIATFKGGNGTSVTLSVSHWESLLKPVQVEVVVSREGA